MDTRVKLEGSYRRGRVNLLMMAVLTLVNVILIALNADISFPFSAAFPQIAYVFGSVFAEELEISTFLVVGIVLAMVSVGLFFLCWALSKKHMAFLVTSLVLFILDSLFLIGFVLYTESWVDFIIDFLFHIWVLYYLITGVVAGVKLRRLPPEPAFAVDPNAPPVPVMQQPLPYPEVSAPVQPPQEAAVSPEAPAQEPVQEPAQEPVQEPATAVIPDIPPVPPVAPPPETPSDDTAG